MPQSFYKPNKSKTGHAVGFNFDAKEGALHTQFIKQTGWDEATKKGSFKEGDKFNIKFNANEIGVILNCIERGKSEKLFHQSSKGNTSIEVKPFKKEDGPANGFTISVNPRANEGEDKPKQFGFWFNDSEARVLKEYLQFALRAFFVEEKKEDDAKRAEYHSKNSPE